ncbi:ABC transporter ATP-binding protein [Kineosporia rhizophila]|uniref:ABC transporter ATP-binding protein n=1 Tax=Kineosporia TaxID=49184 RepID=UPI001E6176A2|nr:MULTISPECIES: ABC transporter ATP-binding protein [Kineosporia]MCE0536343.1 ABC transporter ATP-binding protein [Kineosporia rhizophila]GLY19818.1 multidrug ABC transporter ATP-binding protein [Kineosporia sp. NBRC 101677]
MAIIEVRGLRRTYGEVTAVEHIDLDVAEGEIFGLLGPNGAGKTTTVECIAGLTRPSAGTVRVAGIDPYADRVAATSLIGVQLQQAGLQAKLTVREALELFAAFYPDPADGLAMAGQLGLGEKLDARYASLSGGQQQRLAIALALVGRPRVALLDELTTGLDPASRRTVWQLVEQVRAEGTTIVLVSHLMPEVQRLCDRLALLDRGRVVALDSPAGLIAASATPTAMSFSPDAPVDVARLRSVEGVAEVRERGGRLELLADDAAVLAVLGLLARLDVRPERLRVTQSTLDEAYLSLVGTDESEI